MNVADLTSTTSPWSIGCAVKEDIAELYSEMTAAIPLAHSGAFPFYSHDPAKALQKGFTSESVCLSNHYIFRHDERYVFEVPDAYAERLRELDDWSEDLKFISSSNSEAHIMLLKAAWFGDMVTYLNMIKHSDDASKVKDLGKSCAEFHGRGMVSDTAACGSRSYLAEVHEGDSFQELLDKPHA